MTALPRHPLVFLKLGGSLLCDKRKPRSFRPGVARRLGVEIRRALERAPGMRLLLAHGGGGFAHFPAKRYRTREGRTGGGGWRGFAETRRGVIEMNRRVLASLARAGLHPVTVPPSAGIMAEDGAVKRWDISVLRALLERGQIPLIHGDAVADRTHGFTILSTEELFLFLVTRLKPARIVLACDVEGVYLDDPRRTSRSSPLPVIDRTNIGSIRRALKTPSQRRRRSGGRDVTGGMAAKVERLYDIVKCRPSVEARIVSGLKRGVVEAALLGAESGTAVRK